MFGLQVGQDSLFLKANGAVLTTQAAKNESESLNKQIWVPGYVRFSVLCHVV